jgi:hypothetical protein
MKKLTLAIALVASTGAMAAGMKLETHKIVVPNLTPQQIQKETAAAKPELATAPEDAYPNPSAAGKTDRKTYVITRDKRGNTIPIPEADVISYCSDKSGCTVSLGMFNWDDQGRVASRTFRLFYNKDTKVWRTDADGAGTNNNNVTEHVFQAWACYMTDGAYSNWQDQGDKSLDFGLLSWNQYNTTCFLTLIK